MQLQQDILFDSRYRLIKLLGSGGFSEVWLVEDTKVGNKKMALKVYAPGMGLDDHGVQLFSREFELVFDLNHTNLLRPAYFDVCERSPYLLMPYCEQGSTNQFVGVMTEDDAWHFLHDVAAGLAYLHMQEPPIIHQDIKPDNVLKDHHGNYQISDFGISTKVRRTLSKSMMNVDGTGGTMAYMPPERFGKDNIPIKASDIWAMGTTIFELLTGELPYGEHGGLLQKSGAEIPNIPGKWSNELREIITRCMQKEPWDRPVAQQIVEWTEKRLRGEKLFFDSKKWLIKKPFASISPLFKKNGTVVTFCLLGLVLSLFLIVKIFTAKDSQSQTDTPQVINEDVLPTSESNPEETVVVEIFSEEEKTIEAPVVETNQVTADTSSPPPPPAWIVEYDRLLNVAQTAYKRKDYVRARSEYNRALTLANQNADTEKATYVTEQIAACNKSIETERIAEEARQKEIEERLASYNFVDKFTLGSTYMVVQRKSDNRWGIINREGNEVEPFNYSQGSGSTRLINGYYALKNESGWVVFDESLNKIASGIESLADYR